MRFIVLAVASEVLLYPRKSLRLSPHLQRKGRFIHTGQDFKNTYIVDISKDSNDSKITISNVKDTRANIIRSYVFDMNNQKVQDSGIQDGTSFNFEDPANIRIQKQADGKFRLSADFIEDGKIVCPNCWVLEELEPQLIIEDTN